MACFLTGDCNIPPKKELHRRLQVAKLAARSSVQGLAVGPSEVGGRGVVGGVGRHFRSSALLLWR